MIDEVHRTANSLKEKFRDIRSKRYPTGDPHIPASVIRARRIHELIESRYEIVDTQNDKHQPKDDIIDINDISHKPHIAQQLFTLTIEEKTQQDASLSPSSSPSLSSSPSPSALASTYASSSSPSPAASPRGRSSSAPATTPNTPSSTRDRASPSYTSAHRRKRALEDAVCTIAETSKKQAFDNTNSTTVLLQQMQQIQQQSQQFQLQLIQQQQQFMMQQQQQTQMFLSSIVDKLTPTVPTPVNTLSNSSSGTRNNPSS